MNCAPGRHRQRQELPGIKINLVCLDRVGAQLSALGWPMATLTRF